MISKLCNGLVVAGIAIAGSHAAVAKDIQFSGYTWHVRSGDGGPGPNSWSDSNVWVDDQGRLHVKIAKRDGKWSCAEITSDKSLGFGRYEFDVDTPLDSMDDNIVLGLFNYPTPDIGPDGTNEIDIEFATWGGAQKQHGNFTVWPADSKVKHHSSSFTVSHDLVSSTSEFHWASREIDFSWVPNNGLPIAGLPEGIANWTFRPDNYLDAIPQHPKPVHINLWLFNGKPPTDDKEVEVIISRFTFTPDKPDAKN